MTITETRSNRASDKRQQIVDLCKDTQLFEAQIDIEDNLDERNI